MGLADPHAAPNSVLHQALLAKNARSDPRVIALLSEPIAIVGCSCRFPGGAHDPATLWEMLRNSGNPVGPIPSERLSLFPDRTLESAILNKLTGAFLENIELFDAELFGIAAREAESIDPQQRLLLEVVWEALENAGRMNEDLAGSQVGVFIGISTDDYAQLELRSGDVSRITPYSFTGVSPSLSAGRISYVLGLHGPSLAVDTACSSSLVAIHLACQSLRQGECTIAVAGGANLILTPELSIYLNRVGALSPQGQCKTFDADADGYVRGEGGGAVVLRRLSDAIADRDQILAIIRGTAINHDGASAGLTVPNKQAQIAVIQQAIQQAKIDPHQIDYVELHGTGTPLGDPIEAVALLSAMRSAESTSDKNSDSLNPLCVGSIKTNIGHLEAAAGIAGLIKVILSLQHGEIPPHLHFRQLNPALQGVGQLLEIPTRARPWPKTGRPRTAGISAFGFAGTNAHLIVEEAVAIPRPVIRVERNSHLLVLSAPSEAPLRELAARYARWLHSLPPADFADACYTANTGRRQFRYRLAVVAHGPREAAMSLERFLAGRVDPMLRHDIAVRQGRLAIMLDEVDLQLPDNAASGPFMSVLKETLQFWQQQLDLSQPSTLKGCIGDSIQSLATVQQFRFWGVEPATVLGTGANHYVAAHLAGVLSKEELAACFAALQREVVTGSSVPEVSDAPLREALAKVLPRQPRLYWIDPCRNQPASLMSEYSMPLTAGQMKEALTHIANSGHSDLLLQTRRFNGNGSLEQPAKLSIHRLAMESDLETSFLLALAGLYVRGQHLNFSRLEEGFPRQRAPLPTYPFQRRRYWVENASKEKTASPSLPEICRRRQVAALLAYKHVSASREAIFEVTFDASSYCGLKNHRIEDCIVLPGAAYAEIVLEVARQYFDTFPMLVNDLRFIDALHLSENRRVQAVVETFESDKWEIRILSCSSPSEESCQWSPHATAVVRRMRSESPIVANLDAIRGRFCTEVLPATHYENLASRGLNLSEEFRAIEKLYVTDNEALSRIRPWPATFVDMESVFHPFALDPCLQVAASLANLVLTTQEAMGLVPTGIDRLVVRSRPTEIMWAHARLRELPSNDSSECIIDLDVYSDGGELLVEIEGLTVALVPKWRLIHDADARAEIGHEVCWRHQDILPQGLPLPIDWLILGHADPIASRLAEALRARNSTATIISTVLDEPTKLRLSRNGPVGVVDLRPLVYAQSTIVGAPLFEVDRDKYRELFLTAQKLAGYSRRELSHFVVVTKGAHAVDLSVVPDSWGGEWWGLVNCLQVEIPDLATKCVDLDPLAPGNELPLLAEELSRFDAETRVAFRGSRRFVERLEPIHKVALSSRPAPQELPHQYRLDIRESGVFDSLYWRSTTIDDPQPGKLIIRTEASGLNFLDVMDALGILPFARDGYGMECVGTVEALGPDVEGYSIGDRVLAIAEGSFASHVQADAKLVARCPRGMSPIDACTIPSAYLTAVYSLIEIAKLSSNQSVLIHSASGGVGLAAVHIARRMGAKVFATAGSERKREFLRSLGIENVLDSRSPLFADAILTLTDGKGVDVVLNSLTGRLLAATVTCLCDGGTFLEIGKTELFAPDELPRSIQYFPIAVDVICRQKPDVIQRILGSIVKSIEAGEIPPLPVTVFSRDEQIEAFRFMSQAKQIGKVVVFHHSRATSLAGRPGTCLITGGLGGLGLLLALHLVENGWRHIALISRQTASLAVQAELDEMRSRNVHVEVIGADVSNCEELEHALHQLRTRLPPIQGVFHAAGVLDDGLIGDLDWERCQRVLAPKILGGWNLHTLLRHDPVEVFVLFSSIASILGSAGQCSYGMANASLDQLASYRRSLGLPALSVNWGPWSERGMAARESIANRQKWSRRGIRSLEPSAAFAALDRFLSAGLGQVVAANIDWSILSARTPSSWKFLSSLLTTSIPTERSLGKVDFHAKLSNASEGQRKGLLVELVRLEAAKVLGCEIDEVSDSLKPLREMGVDSLMAMDLALSLGKLANVDVPRNLINLHPTIDALADFMDKATSLPNTR